MKVGDTMKCLVTGATGHIGNTLVRDLMKDGYDVTALVLPGENTEMLEELSPAMIRGDVTKKETLLEAVSQSDAVFHLAGIIDIGTANKKKIYEVNVNGTKNIVDLCIENEVKTLIYVSSVHAIPELDGNQSIHEIEKFSPEHLKGTYAKTKAIATQYVLDAKNKLDVRIVHPSGVIGPYEYVTSNIGQMIEDFEKRKLKAYIEGGYNFVDVRDVSRGLIQALEKGSSGQCYILGGHYITVEELMKKLECYTGVKAPKTILPYWFIQSMSFFAEGYYKLLKQKPLFTSTSIHVLRSNANFCIEKAQKELGYCCRSIDETIRDTIAWLSRKDQLAADFS